MILNVEFTKAATILQVEFHDAQAFDVEFGELHEVGSADILTYDGSYTVKPSLGVQTLETAGKLMEENTIIEPIPIYVVSNNSGGNTVVIGG